MIDGLWSVVFSTPEDSWGGGVAVLTDGRVYGGDGQYFYLGTYRLDGQAFSAKVAVNHYAGDLWTVLGRSSHFDLDISGQYTGDEFEAVGAVANDPGRKMDLRLTRRAALIS